MAEPDYPAVWRVRAEEVMSRPDEQWINRVVKEERDSLCYQVGDLINRIAVATPFPGDIGDEYDRAREALRSLHDKLLREVG